MEIKVNFTGYSNKLRSLGGLQNFFVSINPHKHSFIKLDIICFPSRLWGRKEHFLLILLKFISPTVSRIYNCQDKCWNLSDYWGREGKASLKLYALHGAVCIKYVDFACKHRWKCLEIRLWWALSLTQASIHYQGSGDGNLASITMAWEFFHEGNYEITTLDI